MASTNWIMSDTTGSPTGRKMNSPMLIADIVTSIVSFIIDDVWALYNTSRSFRAATNKALLLADRINSVLYYITTGDDQRVQNLLQNLPNHRLTVHEVHCIVSSASPVLTPAMLKLIIAHCPIMDPTAPNNCCLMARTIAQGDQHRISILTQAMHVHDLGLVEKLRYMQELYPLVPVIDPPRIAITPTDAFIIKAIAEILHWIRDNEHSRFYPTATGAKDIIGDNITGLAMQIDEEERSKILDLVNVKSTYQAHTAITNLLQLVNRSVQVADKLFDVYNYYADVEIKYPAFIGLSPRATIYALEHSKYLHNRPILLNMGQCMGADVRDVTDEIIDYFLLLQKTGIDNKKTGAKEDAIDKLMELYNEYRANDRAPQSITTLPGRIYERAYRQKNQDVLDKLERMVLTLDNRKNGEYDLAIMTREMHKMADDIRSYISSLFHSSISMRILSHQLDKKFRNVQRLLLISWDIRLPLSTAKVDGMALTDEQWDQDIFIFPLLGKRMIVPGSDDPDDDKIIDVGIHDGRFTYRSVFQSVYDYYQSMKKQVTLLREMTRYDGLYLDHERNIPGLGLERRR